MNEWKYGENDSQKYYDMYKEKDYLCVFANKIYPDVWMGMYTKGKSDVMVMDKTFNNRQRKKDELNGVYQHDTPSKIRILSYSDPEKMKKKLLYAYKHDLKEISK